MNDNEQSTALRRISRKRFLGQIGAGAAAVGTAGALRAPGAPAAPLRERCGTAGPSTRFGRIFERMAPFADPKRRGLEAALVELGSPGGLLDANDELGRGPVELITNPALSLRNPDNPAHTAGTRFMGQFMDHDMTFDLASSLGRSAAPARSPNGRTPSFDLDSVYASGPVASPQLYDPADRRS